MPRSRLEQKKTQNNCIKFEVQNFGICFLPQTTVFKHQSSQEVRGLSGGALSPSAVKCSSSKVLDLHLLTSGLKEKIFSKFRSYHLGKKT